MPGSYLKLVSQVDGDVEPVDELGHPNAVAVAVVGELQGVRLGVEAQGVAAGGVGHAVGDAVVGAAGLDAGVALRAAALRLDPHLGKHT